MKDVFTQQAAQSIPFAAPVNGLSVLTPARQGLRLNGCSAAVWGLAVSVGASGLFFTQPASATSSSLPSPLASLTEIPSAPSHHTESTENKDRLDAPSVKYQVREGESLWQISQAFQVPAAEIAAANHIDSHTVLSAGQSLNIPNSQSVAQDGDQDHGRAQSIAVLPTVVAPSLNPTLATPTSLTPRSETTAAVQPDISNLAPPRPLAVTKGAVVKPDAQAAIADVSRPIQVIPAAEETATTRLKSTAQEIGIPVSATEQPIATPAEVAVAAYGNDPIAIEVTPPASLQSVETLSPADAPFADPQSAPLPTVPSAVAVPYRATKDDDAVLSGESVAIDALRRNSATVTTPSLETAVDAPIAIPVTPPASDSLAANPSPAPLAPVPSTIPPLDQFQASTPSYQVRPGDTLSKIAKQHRIDPTELKRANDLTNPNQLQVNQILVIPPSETMAIAPNLPTVPGATSRNVNAGFDADPELQYQTQLKAEVAQLNQGQPLPLPRPQLLASTPASLDTVPDWQDRQPLPANFSQPRQDLAQLQRQYSSQIQRTRFSTSPSQIIGAAPTPAQDYNNSLQIPMGQEVSPALPPLNTPDFPQGPNQFNGFSWPAKGVLTSGYGRRWGRMHRGIDIAGPIGTPIMAAAPGEVIAAGWNAGGFGKLVKIRHADGSVTYYAHNNRILVRKGDYVEQGQQVAEMGSTGRSTGPHLHFEIRPDGKNAINPIALLPQNR